MQENWFRKRRDELNLSQTDVAHEISILGHRITFGAVSGWERGQVPSIDYVDSIAQVYKVTPRKVLDVMHEMSRERQAEKAAAD